MPMTARYVMRRSPWLRHSPWDGLLIALSLLHGLALMAMPSAPLIAVGVWWNSNTISHSFVHLPFFRASWCNRLYSVYLTLILGFPQSLWRDRHLAHHSGSVYRVRLTTPILLEAVLVFGLWGTLLALFPAFFLTVYLPGYVVGMGLCYLHGYFEHAGGTVSHYGLLYNLSFFNDGYHVEHHLRPSAHWTQLPGSPSATAKTSRWPAVLRWIDLIHLDGLEKLEQLALRSPFLQRMLLRTHGSALRRLLPEIRSVRTVKIVGGGMFPRTAILLREWLPDAEITIVDASLQNLETSRAFLDGGVTFAHELFTGTPDDETDLVVIPLAYVGDREALYQNPPAPMVLIHDWLWARRARSVVVSLFLLKRLNLIRH
jgi:hypothetical protein